MWVRPATGAKSGAVVGFAKCLWIAATVFVATAGVSGTTPGSPSGLYHSEDGLVCSDCHDSESPYPQHLKKADHTDLCLSCHTEGNNTSATADLPGVTNGGWTAPIVKSLSCTPGSPNPRSASMPAGDFCFSNFDPLYGHNPAYTLNATGPTSSSMIADPAQNVPQGGKGLPVHTKEGPEWSCLSCHGAHYRFAPQVAPWRQLLREVNGVVTTGCDQTVGTLETAANCDSKMAVTAKDFEAIKSNSRGDLQGGTIVSHRADGNPLEGADLSQPYGDANKNVYRGGFSSFCAACHGLVHGGNAGSSGSYGTAGLQGTNILDPNTGYIRHPTNLQLARVATKYGNVPTKAVGYNKQVYNTQGTSPNPVGYDWRYPLVQPERNFVVSSTIASASNVSTMVDSDRLMCLTCHEAHASPFKNMTRWDTRTHAALLAGEMDPFSGRPAADDNIAFGCQKCHQIDGTAAYVARF